MVEEHHLLWNLDNAIREISIYYMKNHRYEYQPWCKRLQGSISNAIAQRINDNADILTSSRKQWMIQRKAKCD